MSTSVAVTEYEVLEPGERTLEELAATANSEYWLSLKAASDMLSHALACGRALLELQKKITIGSWLEWADANLEVGNHARLTYMRLAEFEHLLPPEIFEPYTGKNNRVYPASQNRALIYIRGLETVHRPSGGARYGSKKRTSPEVEAECKRLRTQGLSCRNIAELVGISESTVRKAIDPAYRARVQKSQDRARKTRLAANKALAAQRERVARDRVAKQVGGALAETYSRVRKTLDEAQRARMEAEDPIERTAVDESLAYLHRAEDAIVKAMRQTRSRSREAVAVGARFV
jgi:transposase